MNPTAPDTYSFPDYLSAKKSVDERAINRLVVQSLAEALPHASRERPLKVLEVGCGIGAMLQRMLDWELLTCADYLGLDALPENIATARRNIETWSQAQGWQVHARENGLAISRGAKWLSIQFEALDLSEFFAARASAAHSYDLLVAHAFLDLIDIPTTLPRLLSLLRPGGLFYFPINFDGVTLLEPVIDPEFDAAVISAYHTSMDTRLTAGRPSGDSQSGRHLFQHLAQCGACILAAGSSDWVVFSRQGVYPADEAYFLHFILHFFETTLSHYPDLDAGRFERWLAERRAQVRRGVLVYIAHQIDFCGQAPLAPG